MKTTTVDILGKIRSCLEGNDDVLRRAKEVGAMGDHLKKLGLHLSFNKAVVASGETYQAKEVLKKFGFKFDKGSKSWSQKNMNLDFHDLYTQLVRAFPEGPKPAKDATSSAGPDTAKPSSPSTGNTNATEVDRMSADTRKTHYSRKQQIDMISQALEIAAKPPSKENDGEMHMVNQERVYYSIFDATYNDIVWRAVEAAKKMGGGWGADAILGAAKDREKLNKTRAANAKKYGKVESILDEMRFIVDTLGS